VAQVEPGLRLTNPGHAEVYIDTSQLDLRYGLTLCVNMVSCAAQSDAAWHRLCSVPLDSMDRVAALPFVRSIRLPVYSVRRTGSVTSAGDKVRALISYGHGVTGRGVKVGIIADSHA